MTGCRVEFRVLGPLKVIRGGTELLAQAAHKPRLVLAALVANNDRRCSMDWLTAAVWNDDPPASARRNLQQYIHMLRTQLGTERILRRPGGYELSLAGARLDADLFHQHAVAGAAALEAGEHESACLSLRAALDLWHGSAYDGFLDSEPIATAAAQLELARLTCYDRWAEAALAMGRHADLVAELAELVRREPFQERLACHLMLALYRCGRQPDALRIYRDVRAYLREHLGVEPGRPIQDLHTAMLRGDKALDFPVDARRPASVWRPRELPPAPADFVGRADELHQLDTWLAAHLQPSAEAVAICTVSGVGGVGKTALAVHWAHRVAQSFPDGQLYINLRGYHQRQPMEPDRALGQMLHSLGVKPEAIPADVDAATALYRSLLADKRVLILLDNAATPGQVRPLLPASRGCLVVVTSRDHLAGLIARDGARRLSLDVLPAADSISLLRGVLGSARVDLAFDAAAALSDLCSHLPLALRIAAANLSVRDHLSLADYVGTFRAGARLATLDLLVDADSSFRTVFAQSYRSLSGPVARVFRLLGLVPAADVTVICAAAVSGYSEQETAQHLTSLAGESLIMEHQPGRFAMHDLVREYAAELAQAVDSSDERADAIGRLFDYYLHTARKAGHVVSPHSEHIILNPPRPGVPQQKFVDRREAFGWFTAERAALLASVAYTVRTKQDDYTWQLAAVIATHLDWSGHWTDFVATQLDAARAARRQGDPVWEARAHRGLGRVYPKLHQDAEAHAHLERALELYTALDDHVAMAHTHINIALAYDRRGCHVESLHHNQLAYELYERTDEQARKAHALNNIGWCQAHLGRAREGLASCANALEIFQRVEDVAGEASTWDSLGFIHHNLGAYAEAVTCYEHGIARYREIGNRLGEAETLDRLGDSRLAGGDSAQARAAWQDAVRILVDLDHPDATKRITAKLAS
jgi:DNA-binding SARP family transcriptional activator/tetratricopeptide (TPR) repeat protein